MKQLLLSLLLFIVSGHLYVTGQSLSLFDSDTNSLVSMKAKNHLIDTQGQQVLSNVDDKIPPLPKTTLFPKAIDSPLVVSHHKLDTTSLHSGTIEDTKQNSTQIFTSSCTGNILTNGSFNGYKGEDMIALGWKTSAGTPDINDQNGNVNTTQGYKWLGKPLSSPDGGTWQNLASSESISQTVNLIQGKKYTICFYYAAQGIVVSAYKIQDPAGLQVLYNGYPIYSTDYDTTQYTWEEGCYTFTATSATATITLTPTKGPNAYLGVDGVCLLPADTLTTDSVQQNIAGTVIDFGKVFVGNYKDSLQVKTLFNSGNPVTFYKVYIGGANSSDFSILNSSSGGGGPITLNKDSLALFDLRFTPTTIGNRYAELIFAYDKLKPFIVVPLLGIGTGNLSITSTLNVSVGPVCINTPRVFNVTIKNNGDQPMQLLRSEWNTNTNNAFTTTLQPQALAVDSSITQPIVFTPDVAGVFSAQARWIADKDTAYSAFFGNGIDCATNINSSITATASVSFDYICIDSSKILMATIKNNGNQPMQLLRSEWIANDGNAFTTTLVPQALAVDSSISFPVYFTPRTVGAFNGKIRWIADKDTAVSNVSGMGKVCMYVPDTARTMVFIPDIIAQAGENVLLTLKLKKQSGMQLTGAPTDWQARIHYNNSILFNIQTNNVCMSGLDDSCVVEVSGIYNPQSDELISIPCVVTLGNIDNSAMVIDTFYWKNNSIFTETQTQNGNITITGICEQGGVRLFIPAKNSTSLMARPNPAQNALQIQYGLREPLTVTLELLSVTGQVVQTIVNNQAQVAGQYVFTQDVSQVGNGVYVLRLKTNKETLSTRVDVVK